MSDQAMVWFGGRAERLAAPETPPSAPALGVFCFLYAVNASTSIAREQKCARARCTMDKPMPATPQLHSVVSPSVEQTPSG